MSNYFLEEKIQECFDEYLKTGQDVFDIDPVHFEDIKIFFGRNPKNILFPFPAWEGVSVSIGNDKD